MDVGDNMSKAFVFLLMVFCHIFDDYCLQTIGPLSTMKQRDWWKEHYPQKLYMYDYLVALLMHSLSWAFMVMLPIAWYMSWDIGAGFVIYFVINAVFHAVVDHLKANMYRINLLGDQTLHMLQIILTYIVLMW